MKVLDVHPSKALVCCASFHLHGASPSIRSPNSTARAMAAIMEVRLQCPARAGVVDRCSQDSRWQFACPSTLLSASTSAGAAVTFVRLQAPSLSPVFKTVVDGTSQAVDCECRGRLLRSHTNIQKGLSGPRVASPHGAGHSLQDPERQRHNQSTFLPLQWDCDPRSQTISKALPKTETALPQNGHCQKL